MFPKWMNNILRYYSLFGFHFISCVKFGGKSTSALILLIQIGLCIWLSIWAFKAFVEEMTLITFLDAINFFLYYLTCASTYWLILYDSYTNQKILCAFWHNFIQISKKYSTQMDVNRWSFLNALIILLIIDSVMSGLAFYRALADSSDNVAHYHYLVIFDQRTFFYLFHLKVITFQLQKIDSELQNFLERKTQFPSFTKEQYKWIRDYYRLISGMVDHMNNAFGVSNLALTLLNFHSAIAFSNFIYSQIHIKFFHNWNSGLSILSSQFLS